MGPKKNYDVTARGGTIRVPWSPQANPEDFSPAAIRRDGGVTMGPHWSCPPLDAPAIVGWADNHGLSVDPAVRDHAQWVRENEAGLTSPSSARSIPEDEHTPVEGITTQLLDFQHLVVHMAPRARTRTIDGPTKGHRGLLVADEPGLGKTIMSLAAVRTKGMRADRVVIICPTELMENWQAEMDQHFATGTFTATLARTESPQPIPSEFDTVIIGWDVLHAWEETLIGWSPNAVIVDEGHFAKSGKKTTRTRVSSRPQPSRGGGVSRDAGGNLILTPQEGVQQSSSGSRRATAALGLSASVAESGGLVMVLTGTPVVNRPAELEPLLEMVGIIVDFGGPLAYRERYCAPELVHVRGRRATSYRGASHTGELHARLSGSGHYVRRTKEVLVEDGLLKKKYVDGAYFYDASATPTPTVIRPSGADMEAYLSAQYRLELKFSEMARQMAQKMRVPLDSPLVERRIRMEGGREIQLITALRKSCGLVKVRHVAKIVSQRIEQGERVVIAAHHKDVVDAYANLFGGLKIQGGMSGAEVERAKRAFNTSAFEAHPVLVLAVQAGQSGHTLCKQELHGVGPSCATMILAEQVWSPGVDAQVQDRIWRIGQDREVHITNVLLGGSIDMGMYRQRQQKRRVIDAIVDGRDELAPARSSSAGDIAWNLAMGRLN